MPDVEEAAAPAEESDDEVVQLSSVVTMVTTNSGLWRVCVYAKIDYTGDVYPNSIGLVLIKKIIFRPIGH